MCLKPSSAKLRSVLQLCFYWIVLIYLQIMINIDPVFHKCLTAMYMGSSYIQCKVESNPINLEGNKVYLGPCLSRKICENELFPCSGIPFERGNLLSAPEYCHGF